MKKMYSLAFNNIHDSDTAQYCKQISDQYSDEIKHPGYLAYVSNGYEDFGITPIYSLKDLSLTQIAKFYTKFSVDGVYLPLDINRHDLSSAFSKDVQNNIEKYTLGIDKLVNAPIPMINDWLTGLFGYLQNHKSFDHEDEIFHTIYKIFNEEFWNDYDTIQSKLSLHCWIIDYSLMLIDQYLLLRKTSISAETLQSIKDILMLIYQKYNDDLDKPWDGQPASIFRQEKRMIYTGLIMVTFISAKKEGKLVNGRWHEDIKRIIETDMELHENPALFYAIANHYGEIAYIDQSWLKDHLQIIFAKTNPRNCEAALLGYHQNSPFFSKTILDFMFDNEVYHDYLSQAENQDTFLARNIVDTILDAIARGLIGDQALEILIKTNSTSIYQNIIQYTQHYQNNKGVSEFISRLWNTMYSKCKDAKNEAEISFLKFSYKLIGFFESISEEQELMLQVSIKHAINDNNSWGVIEALYPFLHQSTAAVGRLISYLIENSHGSYHNPKLKGIVEYLYSNGQQESADKICNECAKRKDFSLKPLYDRYNPLA